MPEEYCRLSTGVDRIRRLPEYQSANRRIQSLTFLAYLKVSDMGKITCDQTLDAQVIPGIVGSAYAM